MKKEFKLLRAFESLFLGKVYKHRNSTQNDFIAKHLFEDLLDLGASDKLVARIESEARVLNKANRAHEVKARRGDGSFGEIIPGETAWYESGFDVPRGRIATIEIGAECKVLAKAMIKQIDRVVTDLQNQVTQFKLGVGSNPITVAIVGVNHADYAVGYEGDKTNRTGLVETVDVSTGRAKRITHKHPFQEANEAIQRINVGVASRYDVTIVLKYKATNDNPFDFEWVDASGQARDYAAALVRISREYQSRY